ncbi:MAG: ABC transporter ATP-binding protein [Halobacteriaceae archaeon]
MAPAVSAEGVSKRYGDTVALDDVTLSVDAGDVFALVGPNGAGKTTLVQVLTGTTAPDAGSVSVLGTPASDLDRERVGVLPQSFSPPDRLTARELLEYYAGLYDDPRPVDDVLADVGLVADDDTWYANLSGGQQRRVCVGVAVVNEPDVLFLDEPTTGIDPAGRQALWSLISDLSAGGTTVFLTTHYMAEAEELADRVALLDDGELAEVGPPGDLVAAFGGGTHLRVETAASPATLDGVGFAVEATEDGLRVPDVAATDIGDVVDALEAAGVEYDAITWTQPTLEDVYLRLTDHGTVTRSTDAVAASGGAR